ASPSVSALTSSLRKSTNVDTCQVMATSAGSRRQKCQPCLRTFVSDVWRLHMGRGQGEGIASRSSRRLPNALTKCPLQSQEVPHTRNSLPVGRGLGGRGERPLVKPRRGRQIFAAALTFR